MEGRFGMVGVLLHGFQRHLLYYEDRIRDFKYNSSWQLIGTGH